MLGLSDMQNYNFLKALMFSPWTLLCFLTHPPLHEMLKHSWQK